MGNYWWLLPPAVVGLTIRLLAVGSWFPTCPAPDYYGAPQPTGCFAEITWGDTVYFSTQAKLISQGHWFMDPTVWFLHQTVRPELPEFLPGAGHPPMYSLFLGILFRLGLDISQQRFVFPFVGVVGIVLIGILGYRLGGRHRRAVGVVSASIAAIYPILWINDFRYLSESIYIPIVAGLFLAMYRFWRTPTVANAILVGVLFGVVGLTRGEGFFILACTVPPLLYGMHELGRLRRVALGATVAGVMALVMAPWVLYNLSRFDQPVLLTSGTGMVLVHGSCDAAFYGPTIGYYSLACADTIPQLDPSIPYSEPAIDAVARKQAIDYMKDNASQLPRVALMRVGRLWGVYQPSQGVELDGRLEGRGTTPSWIGLVMYWVLVPFTVVGAVSLRRNRIPICPLLGPFIAVTATAASTFGVTRYRVPADVAMVPLAAVGVVVGFVWAAQRLRRGDRPGATDRQATGDRDQPEREDATSGQSVAVHS